MWTSKLSNKQIKNGILTLNVEYTDGVQTIYEVLTFDSVPNLENMVKNRIKQLTDLDNYHASLIIGPISTAIAVPSQDELDRKLWFENYSRYRKLLQAVTDGFLKSDDTSISNLLSELKSSYKPEYGIF